MAHKSAHKLEIGSGLSCQILRLFSWGAKDWEMKVWLYSAWSSLKPSEKTSHSRQSAQPECYNLDRLCTYGLWASAITWSVREGMAMLWWSPCTCSLYIQHRHTVVLWPCCLKGRSEAFMWSPNKPKIPPYIPFWHPMYSPRQWSPSSMDFLIFFAPSQNGSLLSGSVLHCMFCVYLTSERRADICHLVVLLFQSCTANRSVQAIKIYFCCCCWNIQT